MKKLSHVNKKGEARMVDVGAKAIVKRQAVAEAMLVCAAETIRLLKKDALPKGDVLAVARVAGIQAAKQTAALVPLCHVLPLDAVEVDVPDMGPRVHIALGVDESVEHRSDDGQGVGIDTRRRQVVETS